ncbi:MULTISPECIES: pitrilysin family protein [unclassified Brevundimonas]|uniref:M16 family metallopeptidase n=1 Tax=unclassified Brevundimonas TaxID=2622653 RepID=UPI000CFB32C8|nr:MULTISPECIES: pitrilysin family protein [unclassified Brevundimonas]PRA31716.1 peptidase M16 [Brevundimonas sp. MYb27]PQZ83589.1 peptidase M16 [Brevundimonas sp. MYb31]PRB15822.1 peptidase M16 [Brevundimonas sp. MYb52]PRB36318.1 peptidase M16 [Brevundimonas sp. MYb46]PRB46954.1 peptidase M16 [Brevundimonas sp. MYb33]
MPGLRTFALTVAVRGGARMEDEARSGWSHLLEHLVFKGAGNMGARDIVERIEAEGGSINAATGYERTSFEIRALHGSLPLAMQVVSDLVFRPTLDPVEIVREKDVVAQEIAEAFDTPDDHVFEMAQTQAYAGQSLGRPILGTVESLKAADRAAVADWRARLYSPDRMVVAVSGAVDENELLALAERWFGQEATTPVERLAPAVFVGGDARLTRKIEQANLVFQLPSMGAMDLRLPALRLFTEILGGGMASRLFQSAREDRGLAYAIDAYQEAYEDAGLLGIYAGAAADRAVELAEVSAAELLDLAENGPTDAELSRAKAVLNATLWMADESPASRAGRNAAQTLIFGAPVLSEDSAARILAQTSDDLRAVGRSLIEAGRTATAVLGPKAAGPAGAAFSARLKQGG